MASARDVVVRAYRAFGIDFQELIHTSRLGRGDPSIDHRRVEVVRRFLERHGTSFEISEFPEDFLPGDIVTYHRPQGRVSQHHIAIVSDQLAPSGRPLIVHNRGWGPQLEDALFADGLPATIASRRPTPRHSRARANPARPARRPSGASRSPTAGRSQFSRNSSTTSWSDVALCVGLGISMRKRWRSSCWRMPTW